MILRQSETSRQRLGYNETLRWLENRVQHCHPSNVLEFKRRISEAQARTAKTLFDMLVEIICQHKEIELRLE